jgi:hypothetical protein
MPFARRPTTFCLTAGVVAAILVVAEATPARAGEHTVVPGENLTVIADRYCTTVGDLVARNGVGDPHLIHVGTRLDVVDRCAGTSSTAPAEPAIEPSAGPIGPGADPGWAEIVSHLHLVPTLEAAAGEFDVPTDLLMALMYTESRWRSDRVSSDGAVGIGQLLPATAAWLRDLMDEPDLDEGDPGDNARMSARLLRFLLDRTATSSGAIRTRVALAAYFQGIGDVLRNGVDEGGEHYADVVLAHREWFAEL